MKNFSFALRINCIFLFCIVFNNICMEIGSALDRAQYGKDCKCISQYYDQKFITLISNKITEDNASDKIAKMEQKLCKYGKSIEKKENIFLNNIKQQYKIANDSWNLIVRITNDINAFVVRYMHLPFENVTHDPEIPQWFMAMLKKHLVDVGFNPQRTHIYKSEVDDLSAKKVGFSWSYTGGATDHLIVKFKTPGEINIKCNAFLDINNLDEQEGKCIFIAQGMKTKSETILGVLEGCKINIEKKDHDQLSRLYSLAPLLAGALKSAHGAHCVKQFSSSVVLHGSSIDTHKLFCKIDFCWKALEWLKKYYTINYHAIPLMLMVKNSLSQKNISDLLDKGIVVTKNIIDEVKNDQNCKQLLQNTYDEQQCCVCFQHPEDMRDIPCTNKHINSFICRQCYNQLSCNNINQRKCPLCTHGCFSYNEVTYFEVQ